jgi:hypothetical protein
LRGAQHAGDRGAASLGACSAVALATWAIATTTALAAPPESSPPFPSPSTSTSAVTALQTVGKVKVMCKADTNKGEVTGPRRRPGHT